MSYVDVGFIRNSSMKNPKDLIWLDLPKNSFFWMNTVTGVWVPSAESKFPKKDGFALKPLPGITDTGTSCSYIPPQYYQIVMTMLIGQVQNVKVDSNGDVTLPCESLASIPSLFLLLGGYWFEM